MIYFMWAHSLRKQIIFSDNDFLFEQRSKWTMICNFMEVLDKYKKEEDFLKSRRDNHFGFLISSNQIDSN